MSIKIIPYKMGSQSGRTLSEALRARGQVVHRVRRDSATYRLRRSHTLVNWGCSSITAAIGLNILNEPANVQAASNKLTAFGLMQRAGVSIPEFTADREYAVNEWMGENIPFLVRTTLNGHSGAGIHYIEAGTDALEDLSGPLYVKYIKKQSEYRVHVFKDEVIDIQQKRKRQETDNEDVNYQVRSHDNGWVFCRDGITEPQGIRELAIAAVRSLGLDFGAVDIIYNARQSQCYVLEVNTAVGLAGSTVDSYVNAIINHVQEN